VEYALFYVEGEQAAYREAIAGVETIPEFTLTTVDEDSFYSYVCQETREADTAWRQAFADLNLVVMPPIVYDSRGRTHMTVVGSQEALSTVVDGLQEGPGVGVEIEELGAFDRRHATIAGQLTDRQLEVVEAATAMGYYDVPREASLADVADPQYGVDSPATRRVDGDASARRVTEGPTAGHF
jgi:predicted DNA binding protein